ncbi:MAG TPA: DegT/DnrJ/EryC1/StrS aminotransferase family protein [Vicinamibacterales bacterium]|nr:DegT/DnrJ/EryC1/StrS aminotransferase family protein [Vicinamibacterales bacterium]
MLTAICRYGPRLIPETTAIVKGCRARGELIEGPDIARFERAFASQLGVEDAVAASYGRMAFYYTLKALDFPAGSEVIVPALTFWVVPEMVRLAGLTPVAADVDPRTFNLDPSACERAITDRTVAVVPTHLYGLPCDMDAILSIAGRHELTVIEDCAHALGARYRGRLVGTFGDASFFSLQTLKPLNTYGGGMAVARDPRIRARIRAHAEAEPWPSQERIDNRLKVGAAQRAFSRPWVFTITAYPALLAAMLWKARPDVYLWEKIRPLDPMPSSYRERYTNVQAAIGIASLPHLDRWTRETRAHARVMDDALAGLPGVAAPFVPEGAEHVYYQYSVHTPGRDALVRSALRRGVDVETFHVDVWPSLPHFSNGRPIANTPAALDATGVVQLPVYAALTPRDARRVARTMRGLLSSRRVPHEVRTDIA